MSYVRLTSRNIVAIGGVMVGCEAAQRILLQFKTLSLAKATVTAVNIQLAISRLLLAYW